MQLACLNILGFQMCTQICYLISKQIKLSYNRERHCDHLDHDIECLGAWRQIHEVFWHLCPSAETAALVPLTTEWILKIKWSCQPCEAYPISAWLPRTGFQKRKGHHPTFDHQMGGSLTLAQEQPTPGTAWSVWTSAGRQAAAPPPGRVPATAVAGPAGGGPSAGQSSHPAGLPLRHTGLQRENPVSPYMY